MATLTGQPVATTFKDLLQMGNSGEGLTGTTRTVQDGDGTNSPLQLSSDAVNMNGTFQLNGVTLTASATKLNNTIVGTGDGTSLDNSIVTYDGTGGNTFQDTDVIVVGGVLTLKNATSPTINVGSTALSTGSAVIKVGNARTGDGASSIDLIGDTTNSSYGLRLIRAGGVNGSSDILHVGTGVFRITATSEIELNATTIDINGTVDISGITTINNNLIVTGDTTTTTLLVTGDTSAGDNAAAGWTASEGLILTGQGSVSDLTFKNDADAVVFSIPTGGIVADFAGGIDVTGTALLAGVEFTSLTGTGSVSVTDILDEDDLASNSATALATQQSIKAYVDSNTTAQDLDFQGDSGGVLSIDLDSEVLDIAGGTGIDTVGSGNTLTASIDSTVTTLTGSQTLTNKTLTTPIISGTAVTATGAELNILDGVTSSTAELNILDGVTSTATELNILDGVTSTTAELNILDGVTSTAAELNILDGVTSTAAELNYNDTGAAVGTVVASKTVTVDANKDVTGFREVVATGFTGTLDGVLGGGTPAAATTTTLGFTSLTGTGSVAITDILDEDDMASDSATKLSTQQSIKAYIDSTSTAQDLDFQGDSGGVLSIDLDSEVLDIAGGTGIDTVGSGNTLTASIDSTVATLAGTQTLTNKTLTTPIISGTAVTATGAELNILDGVTSSTAELNILDGVTSTAAELNILDGVTSTAAELNILDGVTSTAAELNILDGVTSTASELNILDGVTATTDELNYNDTGAAVGTVVASKTVTVDANKDVSGFREVVATGFTGTLDGVLGGGTPAAVNATIVTATGDSIFNSTGALTISKGTTAQQPTGVTGMLRYNSTTAQFEGFSGASPAWNSVGGSAISNDTTTSSNLYPLSAAATSGTALQVYTSDAKYLYKPSDGSLQAPEMVSTNGLVVNSATVSTSYTIPSGSNAMSVGTMTVASGATVTVSSGSKWVVI